MFVELGSGVLLLEMGWCYFPMGQFATCLKEKEDGGLIKT